MAKMTVFHGSYTAVETPRIIVGRNTKDFGPVFFTARLFFKRLVLGIAAHDCVTVPEAIMRAFTSFVAGKIEDYNSAFYYDVPQNILNAYIYGVVE